MTQPDPKVEITRLEREIEQLARKQTECQALTRELLQKEARGAGGLANQIHQLKQKKLMLATQRQHLKVRLNWILLAGD